MSILLEEIAPHLLGAFMIALACVPLVFVWQDRGRGQAGRDRVAKLQREARLAARLRAQNEADPGLPSGWLGGARR
jgi:hypothetical protein